MEQSNEQDKKKLNDDVVVFMRKRSDHEVPRYTARLKTYVNIQRKRRRAATARRASEHSCNENKNTSPSAGIRKKSEEQKDKTEGEQANSEDGGRISSRKGWFSRRGEEKTTHGRSASRSRSDVDQSDRCCRRRRRRRRSCRRRRRRRRRSCRRRRRRRRRRSCRRRRRRRRRSCRRRRRRC